MQLIAACAVLTMFAGTVAATDSPLIVSLTVLDGHISDLPATEPPPASSTSFDLTYGSGLTTNTQAKDAFDRAAARWAKFLADPVTVNIAVDISSLATGILGQTSTAMMYGDYDEIQNLLVDSLEPGDPREAALLPNLPTFAQFNAHLPFGFSLDGYAWLPKANYRALGGSPSGSDGSITFSTNYSWDYDPSDGIDSEKFDFEGVAAHEIGHLLGFTSEVDYVDWMMGQGRTADDVWPRPLDMFRFDTADLGPGFDFTFTSRNLDPGGSHSFYYDDASLLMSTGLYNGDSRQASHWKDNLALGIMDPTAAPAELLTIGENDLIALDLIGWDISYVTFEIPIIPGDVNGDGFVSAFDLTIIITNWGTFGATRQQGDLSGNGYVGGDDYTEVITFWGTGTPPEPLPEPSALTLIILASLTFARRHRFVP